MSSKSMFTNRSAARIMASVFGFLSGIGGVTHGIGEVFQGNVPPSGIVVNSWTQGPIATNMGGEPAMTVVPNLLVAGILTIMISLVVMAWSVVFVQKKHGGLILIFLSIALLLVGGGFGPPIIGFLAGVAGLGINSQTRWSARLPIKVQHFFSKLWIWIFGLCLINGVFLVIGSIILVYFFGLNNPDLFVNSFFFTILSLLLSILTGSAYDYQKRSSAGVKS